MSDGGVHSHINHLFALLETAKAQGVPHTYVHFFADGRDTLPKSGSGYCQQLVDFLKKEEYGSLATIVGRYYAMDRDKRWERVKIAVDALVKGEGEKGEDGVKAMNERYESGAKGGKDEMFEPIVVNGDEGRIKGRSISSLSQSRLLNTPFTDGDTLFFFNYRSDRMREIVTVLGLDDKPMEVDVPKDLVSYFGRDERAATHLCGAAHHHYVTLQHFVPFRRRFPSFGHE